MDIDPEARERLAAQMEARALDLGLTWREIAARARLSYEIVRRLRTSATSIRPLTLRKLDAGLDWESGSAERILNGGKPADRLAAPSFIRKAVSADGGHGHAHQQDARPA